MKTPSFSAGRRFLAVAGLIALSIGLTNAVPVNDMFANRTVLPSTTNAGAPITNLVIYASNAGATREPGEPYHAGVTGGASIWWSWRPPTNGTVTISTAGSTNYYGDVDTVLAIYTGTNLPALLEQASNDDEDYDNDIYTSKAVFDVSSRQTYQIAVDGWGADSGTIRLSIQLGPLVPKPIAPSWALPDPYGVTIYSSNYLGKVVILDFWATWCGPCKVEIPDLVALQNKYASAGLVVVGADVSWYGGESTQTVLNFMATNVPPINYQVVMSTVATEDAYGGIDSVPATFIIDAQGRIQRQFVGMQTGATLEGAIVPLLAGNMRLGCQRGQNQLALRWPSNAIAFTLESTTNLFNSSWATWGASPTVVNGTNTVLVPIAGAPRFFRLVH